MTNPQKDTIYIDVDDEITSIVEKVKESESKIVALVLPKRATALQSIVNMKLLKRSSDDAGKRIVLITSEAALMPLAGAVGMYTAKNLQSKPEIPSAPDSPEAEEELLESEEADETPELDPEAPVGDLDGDEEVFESDVPAEKAAAAVPRPSKKLKSPKAAKAKKDKKSKVPNFDSFRKKVALGVVGVIGLLVLGYLAFFVMPKATITVKTQTSSTNNSINFTADTGADAVDLEAGTIPGNEVEEEDTQTEKASATGEKDLGTKAKGEVDLSAPIGPDPITIPRGTGVSTGNLTYITQSTVTLTPAFQGGSFKFVGSVVVAADTNGDQYNVSSGRTFTVAGFGSVSGSNGSGFSGGTSKIAKVVSQQDVDNAKEKLGDSADAAKEKLKKELEDAGYFALTETFVTKNESVTASPEVGKEGNEVTVTITRSYAMTGVRRDDLKALVENSVKSEMEEKSLQVQDDGIDQAVYRLNESEDGKTRVTMQAQIVLGPRIDNEQLKKDIAGKKKGDVQNTVKAINGVEDAEVSFSPFWVSSVPKNPAKITIEYTEAGESE